jgi:maleate cis-trans isomerase
VNADPAPVDLRPRHVIGMIAPQPDNPYSYYQFYRIFPADSLYVHSAVSLRSFSAAGVEEALQSVWPCYDFLRAYKVQQINIGGVPLSAFAGRRRMLALLDEARRRSDIPISTDFEDVIEAVHALGLKRVVVAAKWAPDLMQLTAAYLQDAGIEVAGTYGDPHTVQQVHALNVDDSIDVALGVGRRALLEAPQVDGLLLLGGAWLVVHAVVVLEAEYGKPVITNPTAHYWAALRRGGLRCASAGLGTLMETVR